MASSIEELSEGGQLRKAELEKQEEEAERIREDAEQEAEEEELEAQERLAVMRVPSRISRQLNDDTLIDAHDVLAKIGKPNPRQRHNLNLRSAYEAYSAGGEPLFTTSWPGEGTQNGVECTDFIFYSADLLLARYVLSLPALTQLRGDNPRKMLAAPDINWIKPSAKMSGAFDRDAILLKAPTAKATEAGGRGGGDRGQLHHAAPPSKSKVAEAKRALIAALDTSFEATIEKNPDGLWAGMWSPFAAINPLRNHYWLPNDVYASSHLALGVRLSFIEGALPAQWQG